MIAGFQNIWAVIPTFNPDQQLIKIVDEISNLGFGQILIVNDGSDNSCSVVLEKVAAFSNTIILHHHENRGKGAALKTGMNYLLKNSDSSDVIGLVCLDSDGQHLVNDVVKVAQRFKENPANLVLGCRDFSNNVPLRSKVGNQFMKLVMQIFHKIKLQDTQTGLRGIPRALAHYYIELPYDRYEFETAGLIIAHLQHFKFIQVPISTVYLGDNISSNFRPIIDSIKITRTVLKENSS